MKRIRIILICVMVLTCFKTNGQISVGFRAGLNSGKWNVPPIHLINLPVLQNIPGIILSLPFEFRIVNSFAFQPEVCVIEKGVKMSLTYLNSSLLNKSETEYDVIKLGYVEIPVMAKIGLGSEKVKFNFLVGPGFGYAFYGNLRTKLMEDSMVVQTESFSIDFKEMKFHRFGYTLNLGGALNFKVGKGSFFADARYQAGISDVSSENNLTISNRGIQLTAGYLFLLPKKEKKDAKKG